MAINGVANKVLIATSALSLISCFAVITSYAIFRHLLKGYYLRVVLYMALCNFMVAIGGLLGPNVPNSLDEPRCYIQYFLMNYFQIASCLWCASISINLHYLIVKGKQVEKSKYRNYIHIVCWIIPLIATFLPLTMNDVSVDDDYGSICYLVGRSYSHPHATLFWAIFSKYLWIWLAYFGMIFFMLVVIYKSRTTSKSLNEKIAKAIRKLRLYPIVLISQWTLATIQSMMGYSVNEGLPDDGFITYRFFLFSGGVFMSIIFFATNQSIVNGWKNVLFGYPAESIRLTIESNLSDNSRPSVGIPVLGIFKKSFPQVSSLDSMKKLQGESDTRETSENDMTAKEAAAGKDSAS